MTHDQSASAPLAHIRFEDTTLDGFLDRVATLAREAVPGADEVSITLVADAGAYTAASTGDLALLLDLLQYEHQRGPCLQAAAAASTVSAPDTRTDRRWGQWAPRAAAAGAGSVLSVGMPISAGLGGALNIYGREPGALTGDHAVRAEAFARHAAVAIANAHQFYSAATLAAQLQAAMHSRAVIEQAKGVIMAQRRCTPDEAFAYLTRASQDTNHKVRDVAAALIADVARRSG
ncbi:GAF and ANTAR domain-containing protein [Actinoplanes sp. URMC 104]|uniref:GAF and ANTAR domain-containing protein n=1 Tax=Actinoplanes sp. URMC 104 TaxID=3423409 RepID=UPI003F1BAB02